MERLTRRNGSSVSINFSSKQNNWLFCVRCVICRQFCKKSAGKTYVTHGATITKCLTCTVFFLQFKDIPKLGGIEAPFYRQNIGMPNYPGYTPGLVHPGLTAGPTPFVPPNHLSTFQPKVCIFVQCCHVCMPSCIKELSDTHCFLKIAREVN